MEIFLQDIFEKKDEIVEILTQLVPVQITPQDEGFKTVKRCYLFH